ncbi:hypothetical protein [Pseudomonas sp. ERMR1:02]|uniref:hypothetical protein n=1 Tax=unclassified Pseudomonas TaxID=196821 RepID=UPI003530CE29
MAHERGQRSTRLPAGLAKGMVEVIRKYVNIGPMTCMSHWKARAAARSGTQYHPARSLSRSGWSHGGSIT